MNKYGDNKPVIKEAVSPHKYSMAADVSLHSPTLCSGKIFLNLSKYASACCGVQFKALSNVGVRMIDGSMALTLIPFDARSNAALFVLNKFKPVKYLL